MSPGRGRDEPRDDEPDLYALGGDDRFFALALIHSDRTDRELEDAIRLGRHAGVYAEDTVLGQYAMRAGPLRWEEAIAAALGARRSGRA